ncbi:MAG: aldose 1-epimerase family protein [Succinivibrio sp.]|nr:aldose 1-epimerase family protein [Succinivibrio sp.]
MFYELENEVLSLKFRTFGGEMCSIKEKSDGTEYIWNGDESWWKFCSPILFPIVGNVRDGKYRHEGKTYELSTHGFSRTSEFAMIGQTSDSIEFELRYSDATLKGYPFKFALRIKYVLKGKTITVQWTVENLDTKEIYFCIGAHPALRTQRNDSEKFEDYYLDFGTEQHSDTYVVDPKVLVLHEKRPDINGKTLALAYENFKGGVHIYDDLTTDTITLRNHKNSKSISIKFPNFQSVGIWTPERGGAPFVCVEPWYGHADYADYDGEFKDREGTQSAPVGGKFTTSYCFVIG